MQQASKEKIYSIFLRLNERCPHPSSELKWINPYTLLVAVILSAQATDVGVNKATSSLFETISSPQSMLDFGIERLKESIKTINYYPTKAKRIIEMSKMLIKDFSGEVPEEREMLEKLPGVGRKTANVVLNVAFKKATIAVDTHVLRVSNRLCLSFSKKPIEVEEDLNKCVPECFKMNAHHHLILHGRYICKARCPACETCFLNDLCEKNFL